MTGQGWQPKLCATCTHAIGDHKSGGTRRPLPPSYGFGVCLFAGCECREFVEAERKAAA